LAEFDSDPIGPNISKVTDPSDVISDPRGQW
jgi:hypothetical protein